MKKKPAMGILVETILEKRDPSKDKPEKEAEESEEEEGGELDAIAQDLIDAVKADDTAGVLEALGAFKEASSMKPKSDDDCGCG